MAAEIAEKVDDDPFGMLSGTSPIDDEDEEASEEVEAETVDDEPEPEPADEEPEKPAAKEGPGEGEEEPEPLAAEAEATPEPAEPEETVESLRAKLAERDAALEKERSHRIGLQEAIIEARAKNQELRATQASQVPNPAQYPQSPPATPEQVASGSQSGGAPAGYKVVVAEDGQSIFVPRDDIVNDSRAAAQTVVEQQFEAFRAEQDQAVEHSFVTRDPERHRPIVDEAKMADQYVGLAMDNAAMSGRLFIDQQNPDRMGALIEAMRVAGIVEDVEARFPIVGRDFEGFFRAWASKSPVAKSDAYNRLASLEPKAAAPVQEAEIKSEGRVVERVVDTPSSMARKGSTKSAAGEEDEREFQQLYRTFLREPGKLSDEDSSRLRQLGVTLGKEGFEEE